MALLFAWFLTGLGNTLVGDLPHVESAQSINNFMDPERTKALKDMILGALDDAGGVKYLTERAKDPRTASAFLTLVGKVLPLQVAGDAINPLTVVIRKLTDGH